MIRDKWIFGILIIAFLVRVFRLEILTTFLGDQGRDLIQIREIVINQKPTLLGHPATIGIFNGPLYFYIVLPFLVLARYDPLGGALASLTFNILGLLFLAQFRPVLFNPSEVDNYRLYEVDSMRPFKIKKIWRINAEINLIRIDRKQT